MAVKVFDEACRALRSAVVAPFVISVSVAGGPMAFARTPAMTGPSVRDVIEGSGSITTAPEQFAPEPREQPSATPSPEPPRPQSSEPPGTGSQPGANPSVDVQPATADPDAEATDAPGEGAESAEGQQDAARQPAQPEAAGPARPRLVISSWPGAYGAAQVEAVIAPLERELDVSIERRTRQDEAQIGDADLVELGQKELLAACRDGKLEALADWPRASGAGGGGAVAADEADDFLVPTEGGCGLPSFAWSSLIVANTSKMKELAGRRYREPGGIGDLIDVKRYPGKRALVAEPRRLLEMMLLASGVERDQLYRVLATRRGEDRAFEVLDALAPSIEWVAGARQAMAAVDDGRATMAMVFSGRMFRRAVAGELKPIWDGHIIDYASWAVTKASSQPKLAAAFIRGAVAPERLAAQARLWSYGPMRRAAVDLARRHALLGIDLAPYMPTSPLRFEQGVILDARFWADNAERLETRFADWRAGVPLGIRVPPPRRAPPPPLPPPPRQAQFN